MSSERQWSDEQITLRNMSAPVRDVMRFTLVYSGQLPSSGNKAKPDDVLKIRRQLSGQLKFLWETNHALQELSEMAFVRNPATPGSVMIVTNFGVPTPRQRNEIE